MTLASCDTAQIMAALGELRGQNAEILRHQARIEGRLDRIEGALVPSAEVKAIERRVGRLENHRSRGAWSIVELFLAGLAAAIGWHKAL
jgi:hypothetical protein